VDLRVALLLALLALSLVPRAQAEPFSDEGLDPRLIASVTTAAFTFMAPRILEPENTGQLAIWGLRGITTLDSRFVADLSPKSLRLLLNGKVLLDRPPPPDDPRAWGEAVAILSRLAWDNSEAVRRAATQGVINAFFDELFNHLDPYSRYASPRRALDEQARRDGRGGVGVEATRNGVNVVVRNVAQGSPALSAGIKPGDILLAIDDLPVDDADISAVAALLAGPEDSLVTLSLRSPGKPPRSIDLRRVVLTPPTVFVTRKADELIIRVTGFARDTASTLASEIVRGIAGPKPPKGLVIDLRGNRGGLLGQAAAVADLLLPSGLVASTAGRDPAAHHEYLANGTDLTHGLPVVILVDGRTASAAEVLAAGLADQRRAVVVGSATLGKGLVQTILPLPDGGALSLTWSRVLAPLGWPLQALGVLPQLCTSLGEDHLHRLMAELAQGRQPMQRAVTRNREARAPLPAAEILEIRNACPASEGRDSDMEAAKFLIDMPVAYDAALVRVPAGP
jgi:carboxyl-terminal processing protease